MISKWSVNIKVKIWLVDVHWVMKPEVVSKILHEALRTSWNFSSAHWLHHPMNVKKSNKLNKAWDYTDTGFIFLSGVTKTREVYQYSFIWQCRQHCFNMLNKKVKQKKRSNFLCSGSCLLHVRTLKQRIYYQARINRDGRGRGRRGGADALGSVPTPRILFLFFLLNILLIPPIEGPKIKNSRATDYKSIARVSIFSPPGTGVSCYHYRLLR